MEVDSGSEVDEDELTEEELRELLQDGLDETQEAERDENIENATQAADPERDEFIWEEDYGTFRGQKEEFNEPAGPKIEGTSPIDLFLQIWDQPVMSMIVEQTNLYAWQTIVAASETGISTRSRINNWVEASVSDIYRLMAMFILMGVCYRSRIDEYWHTGILGMPSFRKIMPLDRFWLLMKFIHFVDNDSLGTLRGHEKKIAKISTILDYVNNKFPTIYTPHRELSIDESLLLWKGRLSWVQCIRTKAARFGIKTYELCEALTGYCLRISLYSGKGATGLEPMEGFTSSSAKIAIKLMEQYLYKGYCLFMDNFYNSVPLTRFFKRNKTDIVGTLNRRRYQTPSDIKLLNERQVPRGQVISRHCGDVSVESWKDVRLVTTVSTFHKNEMQPGHRAGQPVSKPTVIHEYNRCMGGVDLKDQKLSTYLLERKRCLKWYIKVFRRLLNTSILNCHIIHCANIAPNENKLTHREFRYKLAEQLLQRFGVDVLPRNPRNINRLNTSLKHFPTTQKVPEEERTTNKQNKMKRSRCVRCTAKKIQKTSTLFCKACNVCLCADECWDEYHTLETL